MASFDFDLILHELPGFENTETYIWIWGADKIPPHLGMSTGKNYFSLTYKGVEDFQVQTMWRKAKRSNVPMIFVKIPLGIEASKLLHIFESFERAKPGGATCLSPIKEALNAAEEIIQLAHLLQDLKNKEQIEGVFGLHLAQDYKSLPVYGWQDIVKRIETLNASK